MFFIKIWKVMNYKGLVVVFLLRRLISKTKSINLTRLIIDTNNHNFDKLTCKLIIILPSLTKEISLNKMYLNTCLETYTSSQQNLLHPDSSWLCLKLNKDTKYFKNVSNNKEVSQLKYYANFLLIYRIVARVS